MKKFLKTYGFLLCMLVGIVAGCVVGFFAPEHSQKLKPLGTIFTNLMFCVVVPMVFCSIASAIANMQNARRAGKIMGVTVITFCITAGIAALIMYLVVRIFPVVTHSYELTVGEVGETLGVADMIINFFTKPDFMELWSRKAILPLIVAAVLFGFGIQMNGGANTMTAKLLHDITGCIMKTVKIITYYAPIGFFGFFAGLVADLVADNQVQFCYNGAVIPPNDKLAVDYLTNVGMDFIEQHEKYLKRYLIDKLVKIPYIDILNLESDSGIVAFNIDGIFSQDVAFFLNKYNVCVRAGNHCAKLVKNVTGVKNSIRVSLYFYNTESDIDDLIELLSNKEKIMKEMI